MSNDAHDIEVSFVEVAAEAPEESLAHEAEALEVIAESDPTAPEDAVDGGVTAYDPEIADVEPPITSVLGGGLVTPGSDLAP